MTIESDELDARIMSARAHAKRMGFDGTREEVKEALMMRGFTEGVLEPGLDRVFGATKRPILGIKNSR